MEFKIRKKNLSLFFAWVFSALVISAIFSLLNPYLNLLPYFLEPFITALIIAIIQWLVLKNFIEDAHLWVFFTFLGLSLSSILVNRFNNQIANLFSQFNDGTDNYVYLFLGIFQAVQGGFVGFVQWFALRGLSPRAMWWILFSSLAGTSSGSVNLFYMNFVTVSPGGGQLSQNQEIIRTVLTSSLNAIILGLGLIWILQKVLRNEDLEEALEEFDFNEPDGGL